MTATWSQNYFLGSGLGLQAKLSRNLILGTLLHAFNKSLVLSTKGGVDPDLVLDILNNSAARSGLVAIKAPAVFRRDLGLMFESAAELGVPAPLTALSRQLYQAAIEKGYREEDICGSIRVLEGLAGCELSAGPCGIS